MQVRACLRARQRGVRVYGVRRRKAQYAQRTERRKGRRVRPRKGRKEREGERERVRARKSEIARERQIRKVITVTARAALCRHSLIASQGAHGLSQRERTLCAVNVRRRVEVGEGTNEQTNERASEQTSTKKTETTGARGGERQTKRKRAG